ncbi:beta strand repeat-containing protein [Propionivibrio sp.]|uniref:beta strand repeat-containing protein n=1 Tax=Propionivibrio sp. TaxID=2212460 RepID=UPI003BF44277
MFEVKAELFARATDELFRKAKNIGGTNKNHILLLALAGIIEHAHAKVAQQLDTADGSPQHDAANEPQASTTEATSHTIQVAVENADIQQELQQALAELAQIEPLIQELVDDQLNLVLLDAVTGKPCIGENACAYAIGQDGSIVYYEDGQIQALSDQGLGLQYAQAETGVVTDAAEGTGTEVATGVATEVEVAASATAISMPMAIALGALGLAAAAGAGGGGGGGSSSASAPASPAPASPAPASPALASPAPANNAPTLVTLSANTVAENAAGAIIGNLTVTDPDAGNTHTFAVDDARFEVVAGQLKLKAGNSLDHEAAVSVNVTVTATDGGGLSKAQVFAIAVTDVAETTTLVGTAGADTISFPAGLDDFIITGLAGNDTINTGIGNDIIRPGEGADTVTTGDGNDIVVVVGQTAAGQYLQSDITNPGGSGIDLSSVLTLADLNGRVVSEVVAGESIDGGTGTNRLVIYGNVDLTGVTLTNITQFQVNSTVTISAQQLTALGLTVIFGDGESVLNITNASGNPITVDLSGVSLSDFKTLNLAANVTLIVDQADVADLLYLTGAGTLRASEASGTLNLTGKHTTLTIQDKAGATDATHGGASFVSGALLVASEAGETLNGGTGNDRLLGGDGNDILNGGDSNDILRGGKGVDEMHGGAGDDRFVIVGDLSGGGKIDSPEDTDILGFPLTTLNGKTFGEDVGGGVIRGGEGNDTLYVFGTADLSTWDIEGIEHVVIRSDVTFTIIQLGALSSVRGDGGSTVRIAPSESPVLFDLGQLNLSQINRVDIGSNVTLLVDDSTSFGGATVIAGTGNILGSTTTLDLTGMYIARSLNPQGSDGTLPVGATYIDTVIVSTGNATIKEGTTGNDIIPGTANGDILIGLSGADRLIGGVGNDLLFGDQQTFPVFKPGQTGVGGPIVTGQNHLVNGLGGDAGFGEGVLGRNDDGSTGAIDLTSAFGENGLNFFGRSFTSVYVNNNGNITFAGPISTYTPGVINAGVNNPIIAPFWADVDTRGGTVAPTQGGNSTGSNLVYYNLDEEAKIFTVTWDDVGYYSGQTDKLNAFQLQLIGTENGNFDIVYRYEDVNWTTGSASGGSGGLGGSVARAGYSAGTSNGYYEMPPSGNQAQMLALDQDGKYTFTVRNGITLDNSNNDILIGGAGDDVLVGGGGIDTTVFSGSMSRNQNGQIQGEYEINRVGNTLVVKDTVSGRDGTDTLFFDVEKLKFNGTGQTFNLSDFEDLNVVADGSGMPEAVSEKIGILAKFAQAAYWTRPVDLTVGVTQLYMPELNPIANQNGNIPNHVSAGNSGQELYNWLKSDAGTWTFLSVEELAQMSNPSLRALIVERDDGLEQNGSNVYYESGTVPQHRSTETKTDAETGSEVFIHGKVTDQQLLHGSGGAIVAQSGNDMVISFRGTEDVEGFVPKNENGQPLYVTDGPIPEYLHSVTKAVVTYILESKYNSAQEYINQAAEDVIDFIMEIGNKLTGGLLSVALSDTGRFLLDLVKDIDLLQLYNTFADSNVENREQARNEVTSQIAELAIAPVVKTDSYYWIQQDEGYQLFKPLIDSLRTYVETNPEIIHLYVSGHSLGAGMASWFVTDPDGGIAIHEILKARGGGVEGVVFAAPGMVMNSTNDAQQRHNVFDASGIEYTRFEVARDLVADVTQVAQAGSAFVPLHAFQPGQQINLQTNVALEGYKEAVTQLHSMANYRDAVTLMAQVGMLSDMNYLENNTGFYG